VRNKWSRAKWSCDVSCGMGAELSGAVNEHVKEAGSQKSSRISQQSIHIVCLSLLVQRLSRFTLCACGCLSRDSVDSQTQSIHIVCLRLLVQRLSRFTDSVDSHCVLAFACPETVDSQTQSIHRLSRFTDSVDSHCVLAFACPETVDSQTQSIHIVCLRLLVQRLHRCQLSEP
jgi:hypothetical protein